MKVELHLHTMRYSACSIATPFDLMARLIQAGYGAVFITEHDRMWADWEIAHLQGHFPDIRIFPGVELSIGPLGTTHLLVLGTCDTAYLRLRDMAEVLAKARQENHLTVLAHPFRWEGTAEVLRAGLLPDALEYRSSNHNQRHAEESEQAATEYRLRLVNAGDVHSLEMIGQCWISTDELLTQPTDIRDVVLAGAYANCPPAAAPL